MSSINFKSFEEFCSEFPETSSEAKLAIKKMLKIEEKIECKGIKVDKTKCTLPAKENGFCGKHNPDKKVSVPKEVEPEKKTGGESEEEKPAPKKTKEPKTEEEKPAPKVKSPPKKKVVEQECNFTNQKTKVKCSNAGTVKPEGAAFHYCKRHSEKFAEVEKDLADKMEVEEESEIDEHEFE